MLKRAPLALLLAATLLSQACGDQPIASRVPAASSPVIVLPEVEGTACQYGGEYPFCQPAPDPFDTPDDDPVGDGGKDPGTEPIAPEGTAPSGDSDAFADGPLLWAGCILAIAGSTVSVYDVLDKFKAWHSAYQDAKGAYDLWQATVQNNSEPAIQQLYEYQYRQALQRQEDAKGDVSSATGVSYLALGGFALACGAAAIAPTP